MKKSLVTANLSTGVNAKRISLDEKNIYSALIRSWYPSGQQFTSERRVQNLAKQHYLIDNNGIPQGFPDVDAMPIAGIDMWGLQDNSWYNLESGMYQFTIKLDGFYDVAYVYFLLDYTNDQGDVKLWGSADGVNKYLLWDRAVSPLIKEGNSFQFNWGRATLNIAHSTNIKYLIVGFARKDFTFNGVVPYGIRRQKKEILGAKYKRHVPVRTFNDRIGTNLFFAELNPDKVGNIGALNRFYNNFDWVLSPPFQVEGGMQHSTPDDIVVALKSSHMWDYDAKFAQYAAHDSKFFFCLKEAAPYLRPADYNGDANRNKLKNVDPLKNIRDLSVTTNPNNYSHVARICYLIAARYGSNGQIPSAYNAQYLENDGVYGLGYLKYFEYENEVDAQWNGQDGFYNPQEMAAVMSACYDGHKGSMGEGFGVKQADPTMKFANPALYLPKLDWFLEMVSWWDIHRGKGDYPIDVINIHHYNAYRQEPYTPVWSDIPAYGLPPEQGDIVSESKHISDWRDEMAPHMEIAMSETGYDEQNGGMNAPQDATQHLRSRHKAVWLMRNFILLADAGVDIVQQYWYGNDWPTRLEDLNPNDIQRELFYTSGYTDGINSVSDRNRKPLMSWWYVAGFRNELEGYYYSHMVAVKGAVLTVEGDNVIDFNPHIYVAAFKDNHDHGCLVAWMGVNNWSTSHAKIRVGTSPSTVDVIDFVDIENKYTDWNVTVRGNVTSYTPASDIIGKYIDIELSEYPVIIKTDYIGVGRLYDVQDLAAQALSTTSIKLAWKDRNVEANNTRIYRSTEMNTDFTLLSDRYFDNGEYIDTNLQPDTKYYYKLSFVKGALESNLSDVVAVSTDMVLLAPDNFKSISETSSTITLDWDYDSLEEDKIDSFIIYRSLALDGEYVVIAAVDADKRQYRDGGLAHSTTYHYKIAAAFEHVISLFSGVLAATTKPSLTVPPVPELASTNSSGNIVQLFFDEEMKGAESSMQAFSIIEITEDNLIIPHEVFAIEMDEADKTRIYLELNSNLLKNSYCTSSN